MNNNYQRRRNIIILLAVLISIGLFALSNYMEFQLMSVLPRTDSLALANYFNKGLVAIFLLVVIGAGYSIYAEYQMMAENREMEAKDTVTHLSSVVGYNQDFIRLLSDGKNEQDYLMVSLDIDKFKAVNDVFGFACGTKIIRMVAEMLAKNLRDGEYCYRITNDVFYLLLKSIDRDSDYKRIRNILDNVSMELISTDDEDIQSNLNGGIYHHMISFSAGGMLISVREVHDDLRSYTADTRNERCRELAARFADNANIARKRGKTENINTVYLFDESMRQEIFENKKIEDAFLIGIEHGEFMVYYQPKYYIGGEEAIHGGAEALIRWNSAELGFLPPGKFIPLFEQDGNALRLDMHVMDLVCQNLCEWRSKGLKIHPISVNVTRPTMQNGHGYLLFVKEKLYLYDIPQSLIEFEILESSTGTDERVVIDFINEIHALGFKIAMDDFGTGCSSLGLLNRIPLDILKFDKSFFDSMSTNMTDHDLAVVRYMLMMARDLGIKTVAEGIEEKFQVDILRELGCDMVQGYYFSRPLCVDDYEKMLKPIK
ncbi:GGDEF domain-containing phosphodiesterase [uncultured Anaerovibrio sp.]|uniref:GGDEF domain-containing phosphodiesterase n=1 Tax=uncultured Anaerovibrio sp. TaxID=361586 RepID=UPI00263473B6|nr:GGDEF domain-containing phosphodiesterase [uncultured Anaerovibrio sp.]